MNSHTYKFPKYINEISVTHTHTHTLTVFTMTLQTARWVFFYIFGIKSTLNKNKYFYKDWSEGMTRCSHRPDGCTHHTASQTWTETRWRPDDATYWYQCLTKCVRNAQALVGQLSNTSVGLPVSRQDGVTDVRTVPWDLTHDGENIEPDASWQEAAETYSWN